MKKFAIVIAAALLLSGCQNREENSAVSGADESSAAEPVAATGTESASGGGSRDGGESAAETAGDISTVESSAEYGEGVQWEYYFRPGVWRGEDAYFFFNEDGSGQSLGFEMGTGLAFQLDSYAGDGTVTFHFGSPDNNSRFTLSDQSEDRVTLTTEDGTTDTLVYVCEGDADSFRFYSDEEIQLIALNYYQAQYDYTPQYSGITDNGDGTVTVQLFDQVDDHNATAAWYTIDRVTLAGTDDLQELPVDMSAYADYGSESAAG